MAFHHVTFIADVRDFAVKYVTCCTLRADSSWCLPVLSGQNGAPWTCYMHVQTWLTAFNTVMFDKDHLAHCNTRITCDVGFDALWRVGVTNMQIIQYNMLLIINETC